SRMRPGAPPAGSAHRNDGPPAVPSITISPLRRYQFVVPSPLTGHSGGNPRSSARTSSRETVWTKSPRSSRSTVLSAINVDRSPDMVPPGYAELDHRDESGARRSEERRVGKGCG